MQWVNGVRAAAPATEAAGQDAANLALLQEVAAAKQVDPTLFAPDVLAFWAHLERLARWTIAVLLLCDSVTARRAATARLIELAEQARLLGDFATVFAVIDGLSSAPVRALTCLWSRFLELYAQHALYFADMQKYAPKRQNERIGPRRGPYM